MKEKQTTNIHQSRSGISLIEGFYLARNPRTQRVSVISITKGPVYIHDITRQMSLQDLVQMDATGYLEIFESLKLDKREKEKIKNKK